MAEDFVYQLARIGPQSTCSKVPDNMRLNMGLTKIGRGQHNDFYLDSGVLKNFISRSHVEICGKKNENGEVEFVLTDKGLNGTFINDIRTHKTCTLEVGDKITFGHTNGYKIQPGSYAEQPQSEFQFEFQKIPKSSKTSEMISDGMSSPVPPCEDVESVPDLKKESTIVSDRLFLSDIQPNSQASSKMKQSHFQKGRTRKDSSSQSDNDLNTSSKSSKSHSKGYGKTSGSNKEEVEDISGTGEGSGLLSETIPANLDESDEEEEPPKKITRQAVHSYKPAARKVRESTSEEEDEEESSKPEADQRPKPQFKNKQMRKKRTGGDAPDIGSRKKRRKGGVGGSMGPATRDGPATRGDGPATRGDGPATRGDDLEPGVEWYEDDTCDSADCKRPKKKRTPWVQCDDCDGWYHTVCVGANYKKLKDSDEHFNCGCE